MSALPDDIARINALTTNARSTWFALLGVLVFVGITLMGVEHIDFYGVNRATKLPLVDVEVPTRYFFIAAPILTAAIYGYFHLYLIRLWDALGVAEAQHKGRSLGDTINPWLVTDAALHRRARVRKDDCTTLRAMETPSMLLNVLLAWVFGLVVLGFLWWQSLPARDFLISGISATSFVVCLTTGYVSWRAMIIKMRDKHADASLAQSEALAVFLPTFGLYAALVASHATTTAPQLGIPLAPLQMVNEEIVKRPDNWLPYQIARRDFRAVWCKREKMENCTDFGDREREFADEWQIRRDSDLASLRRPDWHKQGRSKPDLRNANLSQSFLAGTDLYEVQMEGAILSRAQMEGADLSEAEMEGANLGLARLEGAKLRKARMEGANLSKAQMNGADLHSAWLQGATLNGTNMQGVTLSGAMLMGASLSDAVLQGADLYWAQLETADLSRSNMQGANLSRIRMEGTNISFTQMQGADLSFGQLQRANLSFSQLEGADFSFAKADRASFRFANLENANLFRAHMYGADFSYSLVVGQPGNPIQADATNLSSSINEGGALRFVDLQQTIIDSGTDFRNAFLDGTVLHSDAFVQQMDRPCQWVDSRLTDERFYSLWRWWIEANPYSAFDVNWTAIAPEEWRDVALPSEAQLATHGLTDCHWKTGPMPSAEN